MEHETTYHLPEEIREGRESAAETLAKAAMFLCSVNEIYLTEQFLGQVSRETQDMATEAGKRYNEAIQGVLNANMEIRRFES